MNPLISHPIPISTNLMNEDLTARKHEVSFLIGLFLMVSLTFMIFYYALPFILQPIKEVQADTENISPNIGREIVV